MAQQERASIGSDFFSNKDSEEWTVTEIGNTPSGVGVGVTRRPEGGYKIVKTTTGTLPREISDGWYTSYDKAEEAARVFLNIAWAEKQG